MWDSKQLNNCIKEKLSKLASGELPLTHKDGDQSTVFGELFNAYKQTIVALNKTKISDKIYSPLLEICLRNRKRLEQPLLQLIDILGSLANGTSTHKLTDILDQGRPPNPLLKSCDCFANTKMSGIMGIVQFLKKRLLKTMSWGNH